MKRAKILLFSVVLLFIASVSLFSAETEVRVIVSKANIRLNPTTQSEILGTAPLGAVYKVLRKESNWYCIKFITGQAVEIIGYIHQSLVEVFEKEVEEAINEKVIKKQESVKVKEDIKVLPEITTNQTKQKTDIKKSPDYIKWKQEYEQAEHTFISWKKHMWIGMVALIGASVATPLIAISGRYEVPIGPTIAASVIGVAGGGLMLTAMVIRSSAKEKMELLLNNGRIKGYITAHLSLRNNLYAVSLHLSF